MANLLGTTVNGALSASGRISVTYDTDRYQFNFLRASGSNWWVTNDSTALGLHVNNVGDKFYFSASGDFYSDTNGWLSTALAGKSNVGHTHDDRYYTETESDGRFQPLENQRLSTTNSPTFANVYATEWFRNYGNQGIYNQTYGTHFYSNAAEGFAITGSGGVVQLQFRSNHQSTVRGFVYADTSNNIGFLNDGGSWALRMSSTRNAEIFGSDLTIGAGGANSTNIIMGDNDEGGRTIHCNSNRIGFLTQAGSWGAWLYDSADWEAGSSVRAPIFYDSGDTTYYFNGDSTTSLRTKGSWRADSADWDGEYSGKIQYHANNWYFQSASAWLFRSSGGSNVVSISQGGNISVSGYVGDNSGQTRDKLRVWDSSQYTIGMKNGYDYGHLGNDEYAMSFQMNDNSGRGFWWGDTGHSDDQGAASLTTDGRMVIAKSLSIGEGEAVVSPSSTPLYVKSTTSGADVVGVDGINGRLFTVTDDLSGSLFSVNTIAGLPVIEAFADNTVTIGKYGYATTWSTTGFMTVPNSANIYRDLFINGGRGDNFGNRLIIGTDATTYTMNDGNLRPVAYLHGAYPVLTLNHTVTSNGSHGPTIQFTHNTEDKQWVIGSNGAGTRLDIGYSTNTNRNPHNGIDDLNGSTFIRVDNGGNVQLGRGNGRSTWVNDTLYVGASDSGDSHMYFGEDSSNWYGLHWYWDSGYIVYLYGRNAGTDTEIMRYTTNSNAYVEWRRHFHMNNYEINYVSQLHFNSNTRFTNNTANYLNLQIGSDSYGSIQVRDNSNNLKGYLGYFDSSGFGLLNSSGNWGIRLDPGNVGTDIFYAGAVKVKTLSGGARIYGDLFLDDNYGYGIVGVYDSYRYQGIFAMGNAYKLAADGQGTGNLYGLAWTHTNVGGQSKAGLEHQLLVMNYGTTLTAIGNGIWTAGTITTVNHGNSSQWNSAYSWGNHASAGYIAAGSTVSEVAAQSNATRFRSAGDISQAAGNHALQIFADVNNDAFMAFHISNDYAVHFGLDDSTNRLYVGGWSDGTGTKYQIWDSRDFSSTNISNWNTAYGWGNHASAGYQAASTAITTSNIGSQSVSNATTVGGITPIQFFNNMGDSHATRTSFDASTPSYNFGFRFIQGNTNGPALGGGSQFYSWYLGLGNDYPATGAGSYGMHVAIPRSAVTPYMSVRYNENNSLGSWIKIAAGYADTAGELTSMNISQFTNNSGYIAGTGSANRIAYWSSASNLTFDSNLYWDNTNSRLGIGTTSPSAKIHLVEGNFVTRFLVGQSTFTGYNSGLTAGQKGNIIVGQANSTNNAYVINFIYQSSGSTSNAIGLGFFNNDDIVVITADKSVGIATTSPNTSYTTTIASVAGKTGVLLAQGNVKIDGGAFGVGVNASTTAGRIDASNDIVAYSSSDERLKENIVPIQNALDKVKSLTGVEFDWKPEHKDAHGYEGHDTGVIAQQVQQVIPSAVRTNETGFLAVRYEKLIGLLIEGMKEQQAQINELKAKLDGLTE
jgi:hypothetical protein